VLPALPPAPSRPAPAVLPPLLAVLLPPLLAVLLPLAPPLA
jgi:hypothetical protein